MIAVGVLLVLGLGGAGATAESASEGLPGDAPALLAEKCLKCHNADTRKGGLDLSSRTGALGGGDSGPALEPGRAGESLLIERVAAGEMPPRNPLSAEEVGALRSWIDAGAAYPRESLAPASPKDGWWAFTGLTRPEVPVIAPAAWDRTPIDRFIRARLDSAGLEPSPEADRRTLIRRVTFDLTGLPPTFEEIESFAADASPTAYERVVDRLLASPAYGEFWGRHWLDVVHYADTHGYDKDKRRDHAWPYRDYVIRALNADMPYDEFARLQIAGDVLRPDEPDAVIASSFVAAGPWDFVGHAELAEGTVEKAKTRVIDRDDMVANSMASFVSLTVHCARCHDHKFDPIPMRDYYRLQAVFAGVDRGDRSVEDRETAHRRQNLLAHKADCETRKETIARQHRQASSEFLTRIDLRIADLRQSLANNPASGPGEPSPSNGYHSSVHASPESLAWVQVPVPLQG